jgi:uncharacterized protein YbjT (DUF2867 family)
MNAILFGATGMIGQGVLRECLLEPDVKSVLSIGRSSSGQRHPKLRELILSNLLDFSDIENQLSGFDACFFCLGVSSAGMTEERYREVTFDITIAAARTLARLNPGMTFLYISGMGTDSSENGRSMWARVKGATENELLRIPFKAAYMLRPGMIVPLHGIKSKTKLYQFFYAALGPMLRLAHLLFPKQVVTTEQLGRAMIKIAKQGAPKPVLEASDIARV